MRAGDANAAEGIQILLPDAVLVIRTHALSHPCIVKRDVVGDICKAVAQAIPGTQGFAFVPALLVGSTRQIPEIESLSRFNIAGSVEQAEDRTDVRVKPLKTTRGWYRAFDVRDDAYAAE